jgi:hypothetical protein
MSSGIWHWRFWRPDIAEAVLASWQLSSWTLADLLTDQAGMSWAGYRST